MATIIVPPTSSEPTLSELRAMLGETAAAETKTEAKTETSETAEEPRRNTPRRPRKPSKRNRPEKSDEDEPLPRAFKKRIAKEAEKAAARSSLKLIGLCPSGKRRKRSWQSSKATRRARNPLKHRNRRQRDRSARSSAKQATRRKPGISTRRAKRLRGSPRQVPEGRSYANFSERRPAKPPRKHRPGTRSGTRQ
jgi:hypothetical protein